MRRVILCLAAAILLTGVQSAHAAHPSHDNDVYLGGPTFQVGAMKFTVPSKWLPEPAGNPARVGQWTVPPLHGEGEAGEVVVFFFGPGIGGTTKDNIESWIGTMVKAEGQPAAAEVKNHQTGDFKISQVVIFGTYNEVVPLPGVPPRLRPNFGLLGAVVESPKGNVYWRFTGPEPLITASIPLFNKIIDSVKPQDK
jgi:hypothetical protein